MHARLLVESAAGQEGESERDEAAGPALAHREQRRHRLRDGLPCFESRQLHVRPNPNPNPASSQVSFMCALTLTLSLTLLRLKSAPCAPALDEPSLLMTTRPSLDDEPSLS